MPADFTAKERKIIDAAWSALEYCADMHHSTAVELTDALKYETGSKTAGRPRAWAKALIIDAYVEGRNGSTDDRRRWLYGAARLSRGVRYGYLLACSDAFKTEWETSVDLVAKCQAAVDAYNATIRRRAA